MADIKQTTISVFVQQNGKSYAKDYKVFGDISGKILQDMFDECVDTVLESLMKDGLIKEEK